MSPPERHTPSKSASGGAEWQLLDVLSGEQAPSQWTGPMTSDFLKQCEVI